MKELETLETLETFAQINWTYIIAALMGGMGMVNLIWKTTEWLLIEKLGIKTRFQRQRERERELLITTANELKEIVKSNESRDQKIEAILRGNMELLGDKIDQRFSRYLELEGIPENEIDEFEGLYSAYKKLNGNHGRDKKYRYVKEHMVVIPVKTKLMQNREISSTHSQDDRIIPLSETL